MPLLVPALAILVPIVWTVGERVAPGASPWLAFIVGLAIVKEAWPSRRHVDSWATGARGEAETDKALARLGSAYLIFHDRRIPGSRANIDHIVVGPTGVFVVETKNVSGKVAVRRGVLFVARRRRQTFVEQAWREAVAVQAALSDLIAPPGTNVRPLLCFHRADLPWRGASVAGVPLLYRRGMLKTLRAGPERLSPAQVVEMAAAIERELVPA